MRRLFRIRENIPRPVYLAVATFSLLLILMIWIGLSYGKVVDPLFLPTPGDVLGKAGSEIGDGTLWSDMGASVYRIGLGFLISTLLAIPVGVIMGSYKIGESFFEPPIDLIRYMPAVAFVPLAILWVGTGDSEKLLILFIGTFFQEVLLIMDNVKAVPRTLINVAYTFGLRQWEVLLRVIVPAALPGIVDTLRITMGWAWTYLVVAELVAADSGLGFRIMQAERYLDTATMILGVLVIGLLGLIIDFGFKLLYARCFPYMRTHNG
jgi:NitT/TauT family transport system permease protein